ncbi:MAG: tryptophan synthase subunit alpha [Bacteroidota bacterium]
MPETTSTNRIEATFQQHKQQEPDGKLVSLFLTAGYPDPAETVDLILGMEEAGADMIELGMPFSDPLADGPTIQYSSQVAIEKGIDIDQIFKIVAKVREQSNIPIILMGYLNPVLRYGIDGFFHKAADAGVDGLILPDVPPEESGLMKEAIKQYQLPLIYLVAPNTSDERMKEIDEASSGFVYCVSVTGVTGAREGDEVAQSVERFIDRVDEQIQKNPTMIGFGIKSHEDAQRIAKKADGFIVGSALIDTIRSHYPQEGWKDKVFAFVRELKYGKA